MSTAYEITPTPSDDEVAAILAAYETLWPRPPGAEPDDTASRWRFSGRWWVSGPQQRRRR